MTRRTDDSTVQLTSALIKLLLAAVKEHFALAEAGEVDMTTATTGMVSQWCQAQAASSPGLLVLAARHLAQAAMDEAVVSGKLRVAAFLVILQTELSAYEGSFYEPAD